MLDRYWRSVELGLTAHFLFSFTVDAVRGPAGGETRSAVTLRVDVEGNAIEGYAARRCRSTGELRQTLVRVLDATDAAPTPPEGPRGRIGRLGSRGFARRPPGRSSGGSSFNPSLTRACLNRSSATFDPGRISPRNGTRREPCSNAARRTLGCRRR